MLFWRDLKGKGLPLRRKKTWFLYFKARGRWILSFNSRLRCKQILSQGQCFVHHNPLWFSNFQQESWESPNTGFFFRHLGKNSICQKIKKLDFSPKKLDFRSRNSIFQSIFLQFGPFCTKKFQWITKSVQKSSFYT